MRADNPKIVNTTISKAGIEPIIQNLKNKRIPIYDE